MSRFQVFTDGQWSRFEPLLPSSDGQRRRPFRNHRQVVEGIAYRTRCGIAWRDLPEQSGPRQTAWKRHRRFAAEGLWDRIYAALLAEADVAGKIDSKSVVSGPVQYGQIASVLLPEHGSSLVREILADKHQGVPATAGVAQEPSLAKTSKMAKQNWRGRTLSRGGIAR